MTRPPLRSRSHYAVFHRLTMRWSDNDVYGHVNNVMHYAWFDTAVNTYLVDEGGLDITKGAVIGLVVESGCRYARPLAFPGKAEIGIRACPPGRTSVRYELGIFAVDRSEAAAEGYFVHVFVERETRRPVAIPDSLRATLHRLTIRADRS